MADDKIDIEKMLRELQQELDEIFETRGSLANLEPELEEEMARPAPAIDNNCMTPDHPRWREFCDRLAGPEGCNFKAHKVKGAEWLCAGGTDKTFSTKILAAMGFDKQSIARSLDYFESRGGYCDCEILFNVDVD